MSVHAIMRSTAHRAIFPAPSFAPAPSLGLGSRVLQTRSFRLASTNNTTWSLQSPARKPTKARQGIQNPSFSTSAATMSAANFLSAIQHRRTHYVLNDKSPVSDDRIEEILKTTVQAVPSSFNAQSVRYVVLLKDQHKKFWDIVLKLLQPHIKEATREGTEKRLAGFRAAYGTVLFYEDPDPLDDWKRKVPQYSQHFGVWSEQGNAMNQFAVWTALDAEGFGANLQHYNPIVDIPVASEWNIPLTWKLTAQLVFGGRTGDLDPKPKDPVEKKLFIHGK